GRAARGEVAGATWICGPPSAGKTHLLQAICSQAAESRRAGYFPLAELATLGVGVLEGLPQLQCVCLDDLEAVIGRMEWEKAIFGLLREVEECGGVLMIAPSSPAVLLASLPPDLWRRAAGGVLLPRPVLDAAQQQALQ